METPDIRYLSNNPVHIISAMLFSFQLKPVFSYLTMWMTLTTADFNDIIFSVNRGSSRIEGTTLQWNCQTERGSVKGRGITLLQDWVSFVWTGDTWAGPDPPCLKWESPGAEWWGINPLRLGRGGGNEGVTGFVGLTGSRLVEWLEQRKKWVHNLALKHCIFYCLKIIITVS